MNKQWSETNKIIQKKLGRKDTFREGIKELITFRDELFGVIKSWQFTLEQEDYVAAPFLGADGYHSKTVAYSIWHIFRIEDIVANTLIAEQPQILFDGGYAQAINSPIITTGNELVGEDIISFSQKMNLKKLYEYVTAVKDGTDKILKSLSYEDLKRDVSEEAKQALNQLHVVSDDENAVWLKEYWCGKKVKGLIQMPFVRHWIMHLEASLRILDKHKGFPTYLHMATVEDTKRICEFYHSLVGTPYCAWTMDYPNEIEIKRDLKNDSLFYIEDKKGIVATISIDEDENVENLSCWKIQNGKEISRIGVRPDMQRRGIARYLVRSMMYVIKERGFDGMHLIVAKSNKAALASYSKLDFANRGELNMYEQDWYCYEKKVEGRE